MGRIVRSGPSPLRRPDLSEIGRAAAQAGDVRAATYDKQASDGYLQRIAKYIPAEILAFFVFVNSILSDSIDKIMANSSPESYRVLLNQALDAAHMAGINVWLISWFMVVLGMLMTPVYLFSQRNSNDPDEHIWLNSVIAVIAFPIWAYAVNAVAFRSWHDGALASIIVATFSIVSGGITPDLVARAKSVFARRMVGSSENILGQSDG